MHAADQGRPPEPPPLTNGSVKVPGRFSVGPTPPTDGEASEYHTPAAVIIGVTVGGAVAVAIAFLSFVLYCMRRRAGQESGLLESAMRASRAPSATSDKGAAGAAGKAARNGSTDAAVYVCDACGKPSSGRVSEPGSTNTNGDWVQVRAAPPGAADAADDSSHLSPAARLSGVSAHTSSPSGQSSGDQTPVPPPALVRARSSHRSGLSASSPSTSSPSHPAGQAQEENGGVVTRAQGGDICLTITEKSETLESLLLAAEHEAQVWHTRTVSRHLKHNLLLVLLQSITPSDSCSDFPKHRAVHMCWPVHVKTLCVLPVCPAGRPSSGPDAA